MRNTMNDKDIDEGRITEIEEQHKNERLSLAVNHVKELIPNHIYQFKRPFDAYFCMDGRVQVAKDAICECKRADSVSATLYFFDSDKNLPFEAACYISKRCSEYLVDITGTEAAERRNL